MGTNDTFKAEVYNFIKELGGGVSFAQITEKFGTGNCDFLLSSKKNIYMWTGMPEPVIKAITELLSEKVIVIRAANPLCYALDGMSLNFPIVTEITDYEEPRWLPAVLWTKEEAQELEKQGRM